MQPNLELHPHQEIHLPPDSDSSGCCGFWRSRSVRKKEFGLEEDGRIVELKPTFRQQQERILANQRFAKLIKSKFQNDPINENIAFDILQHRVNHDFKNGDKITEEKLVAIINMVYQIKKEIEMGQL